MRLKLENPKLFSDIVSIISSVVNEVRMKINPEGVSVTAIDPANVAMVYFKLPADLFSEYQIEKEEVLGINLENLKAVLRRSGAFGALVLEKEENTLKLTLHERIKREFILSLIEIDAEEKEIPKWEFNSVIKLDSEPFADVIEDGLFASDACTFIATPNSFSIESKGLNSVRADFTTEDAEIYSSNSKARFSLEYLNKFTKGAKISQKVTINFSDDHPMRLDYPTGNVMLSFILAPRSMQDEN